MNHPLVSQWNTNENFQFLPVTVSKGYIIGKLLGHGIAKAKQMKILGSIVFIGFWLILSQSLTNDHLKVYDGEWEGSLTYLNYGDDKTLVTLPLKVEADYSEKGVEFKYFFTEPGGRIEKRTDRFRIKKKNIYYNGNWEVVSFEAKSLEEWTLSLESEGKDNNQKASFKKIINVSPSKITIKKMVKYAGTEEYFVRNSYLFER